MTTLNELETLVNACWDAYSRVESEVDLSIDDFDSLGLEVGRFDRAVQDAACGFTGESPREALTNLKLTGSELLKRLQSSLEPVT